MPVNHKIFSLPVYMIGLVVSMAAQSNYENIVAAYRDSVNNAFADASTSILPPSQVAGFQGLDYFPVNKKFKVKAKFTRIENADTVIMKTSGTRTPPYRPYGWLNFKIDGKKFRLALYQSVDPQRPHLNNYLLLAFTDLTTGKESYGGGRYLEFTVGDVKHKMVIDFNYCFNPYCAYSDKYSCVIPPAENFIDYRIAAGVRKYHE